LAGNRFFLSDELVRRELEYSWEKDLFLGLHPLRFSNIARNGNQASIQAYQNFGGAPVTGLNRGFLESCFRITDYPVRNTELRAIRGEKPALIFPIGWQIGSRTDFGIWMHQNPCCVSASFSVKNRFFLLHEMARRKLEYSWEKDLFLDRISSVFRISPGMVIRAQFWHIGVLAGSR